MSATTGSRSFSFNLTQYGVIDTISIPTAPLAKPTNSYVAERMIAKLDNEINGEKVEQKKIDRQIASLETLDKAVKLETKRVNVAANIINYGTSIENASSTGTSYNVAKTKRLIKQEELTRVQSDLAVAKHETSVHLQLNELERLDFDLNLIEKTANTIQKQVLLNISGATAIAGQKPRQIELEALPEFDF